MQKIKKKASKVFLMWNQLTIKKYFTLVKINRQTCCFQIQLYFISLFRYCLELLRADVSKYRTEVYKSEKTKNLTLRYETYTRRHCSVR